MFQAFVYKDDTTSGYILLARVTTQSLTLSLNFSYSKKVSSFQYISTRNINVFGSRCFNGTSKYPSIILFYTTYAAANIWVSTNKKATLFCKEWRGLKWV